MAIKEAVISIKMVLDNLKAASDLTSVLSKMRKDISATEKEFAKLKAQLDNGTNSEQYARNLKKVGDTLRGLVSDYQAASGGVATLEEANDSMTASIIDGGKALERMAEARKLNTEASLAAKAASDKLGEAMGNETKEIKKLKLADANRKFAQGDANAFEELKQDPNFTKAEIENLKVVAQLRLEQEGIFEVTHRTTTEMTKQGELKKEEITDAQRSLDKEKEIAENRRIGRENVKKENDNLDDQVAIKKKLISLGKENLVDLQDGDLKDVDLKDFTGKEGLEDFIDKSTLEDLIKFRNTLSKSGDEGKKLDKVIEKLQADAEAMTTSVGQEAKAEERLVELQEKRARLGISNATQDKADRREAIEALKKTIKQRKELTGDTRDYYTTTKNGGAMEVTAVKEMNRELLEQHRLRIQDKAALKGLDRRRKIIEETRKEIEQINRLRQEGMLADTTEGNEREANRLANLANQNKRTQLGIGESFKANLNEPAMRASRAMREVGQGMQDAGRQALMFSASLLATFVPAIKVFADFNQEVQNVVSVLGDMSETDAADALDTLSKKFMDLGESTEFTANQIASAAKALALAGFSAREVTESIEAVTSLASAGNLELEQTAGYFSNIVRAFDIDTSNAERVADVLATVATNSNTTIETLGESFKFIAPIASATGQSLEQVSTALGVLGNAGISASRAGTGLSRAFSELLEKKDDFSEILQGIGSSYDKIDPTRRTITEIVSELERLKAAGLLDTTGFFDMFDQRSARAVLTLVNQGAASMEELGEKAENSAGAADRIKNIRLDTLSGDLLKMQSAMNSLQITIGELFGETAREIIQTVTRMTKSFREFAETGVGKFTITTIGVLITALGLLAGTGGMLALVGGGLVRLGAAFSTTRTVITSTISTIREFGGVMNMVRGNIEAGASTIPQAMQAMATSSSGANAGFLGMGVSAGALGIALLALAAVIVVVVGLGLALSGFQAQWEAAFGEKNKKRIENLTETVDGFSSSIRKAANSLDLIRKLPDLNLTQLKELTGDENLFTLDFNETKKGLADAVQTGLDIANKEASLNLDGVISGNVTWDGVSAQMADLWSDISTPFMNFAEGEFGNMIVNSFKGAVRNNPFTGTAISAANSVPGQFTSKFSVEFDEETQMNQVFLTRSDTLGLIRKTKMELSELTLTQQDAIMSSLAAEEQLKKLEDLKLQREEMITAFSKGRVGIEEWRLKLKEKELDTQAELDRLEETRLQAERQGLTETARIAKLDADVQKKKLEGIKKNLEMADRAAKSSENELKNSTKIMQNQVAQGEHLEKINKLDREITDLQIKRTKAREQGGILSRAELDDLANKKALRLAQLDLLKKEKELTEGLLETQYKITENEKRRKEIIEESNKARKTAKDAAEKTEEELEASAPIGTDAEGNPIFRTPEQEKERQRKKAREKQVGNITPQQARDALKKLPGLNGKDGFDPSVSLTPEENEIFQKEVQKLQEGTSDIGTLGEFGVPVLGSMMEKKFATGVDADAYIKGLETQVKDIEDLKQEAVNLTRNTDEDETVEEFEFRRLAGEKEVRKLEDRQEKLRRDIKNAKKAQLDGGKALDDKIKADMARRDKQEQNLDALDSNIKAKEAEEERKKAAEEAKKEKEREDKEREKLFKKKQEALDEAAIDDKRRELKMAKLNKNKKLEETLTEELAKLEREKAADRKFGTEEELKELKKDKNMTAEQKKILNETIANKAKFIKKEEELFKAEQAVKKAQKKDEQIEDLNKKAQKSEEKRVSNQEKIRDAMLKQAKSLRDVVLITKFLNKQEAIRRMAQEKARKRAVNTGSNLAKLMNDPNKSDKQKQSLFSKAARNLRKAKEMGVSDLELQNLINRVGQFKDEVMNLPKATPPVVAPGNPPVNNPVNQKGAPPVQGGIVNNVANPNVIFNLAGIKDPDQFMNFIGNNAEKITKALFTKGGQQKAKNQGKNTPAQGPAPKGNFSFRGGPGPSVPGPFGN